MGRPPRSDPPGAIHHVSVSVQPGRLVAADDADRTTLLVALATAAAAHRWDIVGWCFLDTHVHFLLHCHEGMLGRGMGLLLGSHARRLNKRQRVRGHLWRSRYVSRLIRGERQLVQAAVYVDLNPVRAGVVTHPREHRWCGFRATAGEESVTDPFRPDLVLSVLHHDRATARQQYAALVDSEVQRVHAERRAAQAHAAL